MDYINNKIFILFIVFNYFLFPKQEIIYNPELIIHSSLTEDFNIEIDSDSVETTDRIQLNIIKDNNNEIIFNGESYFLNPNFFLCQDESQYYYLFAGINYYQKFPYIINNKEIEALNVIDSVGINDHIFGCIKENSNIPLITNNEIILYGNNIGTLFFIFTKQSYVISKENYPADLTSCKLVKSMHYICAYLLSNEIKIIIVKYINQESEPEVMDLVPSIPLSEENSELDNLILYDTDNELYKILCATKNENRYIQCLAVYIKIEVENDDDSYVTEYNIFELTADYSISYFKKHRCYLTIFNSEFLLCCGGRDIISCYRNKLSDFQIINQFTLNLIGSIESVLITDYSDHAIISYMNVTSTDLYLYQYNIYIPKCNINIDPISIEINSFGYYEIDLSQIIVRMTNTKYLLNLINCLWNTVY